MASLAFGMIGGYFFGPIGFMLGSALGNFLFPGKGQDGPRINDLKLQGSSYGQMIPIPYGKNRMAGQVIWQTDLQEHAHKQGGKGGPQVTTYTYTVSFAVAISTGPIVMIQKIWADGTLVYDVTGSGSNVDNSKVPMTWYKGDEQQLPDPTMESVLGVGNVPAHRGTAYAVFKDWDVGVFGNRIPSLSFLTLASPGPIPRRISTFTPFGYQNVAGANGGGARSAMLENGQIAIGVWTGGSSVTQQIQRYDFQGNLLSTDPVNVGLPLPDSGAVTAPSECFAVNNNPHICIVREAGTNGCSGFYYDGNPTVGFLDYYALIDPGVAQGGSNAAWSSKANAVYTTGGSNSNKAIFKKWDCPVGVGVTGSTPIASYTTPTVCDGADFQVAVDDVLGFVYFAAGGAHSGVSGTNPRMYKFDLDLNLIDTWTTAETLWTPTSGVAFAGCNIMAWNGLLLCPGSTTGTNAYDTGHHPIVNLGVVYTNPGGHGVGNVIALGTSGTALGPDGVLAITPDGGAVLSDIVSDVSLKTGQLTSGNIDVTPLTDNVPGYLITQQGEARSALAQLQQAYFFDGGEDGQLIKFIKRGGTSIITVPDWDLAAQIHPAKPEEPLKRIKRANEWDLPDRVEVTYLNIDADLQQGMQYACRETSKSQVIAKIDLAIAMSDAKAKQIAYVLLYESWIARQSYMVYLPRKYAYLMPTDVITVSGFVLRVVKVRDVAAGILEMECVEVNGSVYYSSPTPAAVLGYDPSPPQGVAGNPQLKTTAFLMLDIPLVADTDIGQGVYTAMAGGSAVGIWGGAGLYKSSDGGATYNGVATTTTPDVFGKTTTALPDNVWGAMFDETSVLRVTIGIGGGTLASATEAAVLNGANAALVGKEIIHYKHAVLVSTNVYDLSGLLRGCRGTEFAALGHVIGENFVALPASINLAEPTADLNSNRLYKGVTVGDTLGSQPPQTLNYQAVALRPYSPVLLGGGLANAGGDVSLNWTRRTRINGAWVDYVDAGLGESVEQYVVQIWDSTYSKVARIIVVNAAQTTTYTSAQQVTDFGANQQTIFFTVGQVGTFALGVQTKGTAPGAGGSNTAPITPIPPYNAPPPPISSTCTLPVTSSAFTWSAPVSQYNPSAGPTGTWVITFTTPVTPVVGACRIDAAEFAGPAVTRDMVLALSPCGAPINAGAHAVGNTVSIIFYMTGNPYPAMYPTLAPNTLYYISINSVAASGMICNLYHT